MFILELFIIDFVKTDKFILIRPNYKLTLKHPKVINVKLLPTNPYIIQETGDENIQTYQVEAVLSLKVEVLLVLSYISETLHAIS